ncbi:MAG: hypothetical protein DDT39_01382 [Firmicutes bacterium]|nr:hypothetical protein [candidate division NPL-UPA2 bacterium]
MLRTQIQLTEQQAGFLKARAAAEGISMAELIRKYIDNAQKAAPMTESPNRVQRAAAIVGQFRSGMGDLAENHDKYLAVDYAK